jgi:6-phosphogluconolactonase
MKDIHVFDTIDQQALGLANSFQNMIRSYLRQKSLVNIAISGGNTPIHFFTNLTDHYNDLPWDQIQIFWVDERCVPPDHEQSNYMMARRYLLNRINIPSQNVFRIYGELNPENESKRYSKIISDEVCVAQNWPVFDWILLGMGEDGHTASLFPGSQVLMNTESISDITYHPESGQIRITLTLPVLNHANRITFLVSGSSKAQMVRKILQQSHHNTDIPASMVKPRKGHIDWYLDKDAAAGLD